jgi:N utilization substance protein B
VVSVLPGSRHQARERALALLYEADTRGVRPTEVIEGLPVAPAQLACELAEGVEHNRNEVDDLISRFARGWTIDRMAALDRALLRIGVFELVRCPEVPTAVVLSEAVELAKQYSTEDSSRFVNGVLAAIATEIRPVPTHDGEPAPASDGASTQ